MYIHCVRQNNDHPKMSMSSQESDYLRLHGKERIPVADHLTLRCQAYPGLPDGPNVIKVFLEVEERERIGEMAFLELLL